MTSPIGKTTFSTARRLEWMCAATGISGSLLVAVNLVISPIGWFLLCLSSCFGIPWALKLKMPAMVVMQSVFMIINVIGISRNAVPMVVQFLGA